MGKKVAAISKTHVASSRIDGSTADVWVRRHILGGTPNCDVLWIDEISQLDIALWAQLAKLQFLTKPMGFIMSGDANQFGAIGNTWRSAVVDDEALWHSDLLFDFCGGHRIELVECLRSDKALFDAYSCLPGMHDQGGRDSRHPSHGQGFADSAAPSHGQWSDGLARPLTESAPLVISPLPHRSLPPGLPLPRTNTPQSMH